MRAIDKLKPPCLFYYEDTEGNNIPYDLVNDPPNHPRKWYAQHSLDVSARHEICFGFYKKDLWPIKFMKWLMRKMPESWKRADKFGYSSHTIHGGFPMVKYLVEQRGFSFTEACVTCGNMCGRCQDICEADINGTTYVKDYTLPNTHCQSCDILDPDYINYRRVWACYRTMKLGGDVAKAYKTGSPESSKYYFYPETKPKKLKRLWHYFVGHDKVNWGIEHFTCQTCDIRWEAGKEPKKVGNKYMEWR